MVRVIPVEFYKIIINNKWDFFTLKEIFFDFDYLHDFDIILNKKCPIESISIGVSLNLFKAFVENRIILRNNGRVCQEAAKYGRLDILEYAHEQNFPWDEYTCYLAASRDQIQCLKYAYENGCPWDKNTIYGAILNKSNKCLQYAIENDCMSFPDNILGIISPNLFKDQFCFSGICHLCSTHGNLQMLKHTRRNGYKWTTKVCEIAAKYGHLHCLIFGYENGYPWGIETTKMAFENNNIVVLKYAIDRGCPCPSRILYELGYL